MGRYNLVVEERRSFSRTSKFIVLVVVLVILSTIIVLCEALLSSGSTKQGLHSTQENITIKLGFIAPLHSGLGATSTLGIELETAFRIAVEIINAKARGRVRLSTDFKSMVKDGGLDPSTTCKIAAQQLAADPDIVGVVGGLRSSCSIASHQYFRDNANTMTQISYGSTSPMLSNKKTFPKFFRTCASDVHQASALVALVTHFNWKRVSTITSTDISAKNLSDRFETQSRIKGVRVVASSRFSSSAQPDTIERKVQLLKDSQTRVNLVSSLPKNAQTVFQKAKDKGMSGQGWVWIGTDGVTATPLSNKTHPDIKKSMQGAIGIAPRAGNGGVFLQVVVHWWNKRNMRSKYPGVIYDTPLRTSSYVPQVYDAVNAYYLAFDRLEKAGKIAPGDSPQKLRSLVFDELKKFNNPVNGFESALGMNTYFDSNFDGPPAYDVVNLKGIVWERVATWNKSIGIEKLPQKNIIWPGNTRIPPTDKGLPGKTTFRIGFLAPTLPELGVLAQLGKEFQGALNVAVDMMNKDLSLSVDFDVKVQKVGKDPATDCKVAAGRLANDGVVAVIGAYRSDCSAAAAKVFGSSSHRVPQVSFGSTSSRLSDKTKYKYFFRTSSSDANQARALAALFRKYRWPEVGILSTSDAYGGDLADDFKKEVEGMPDVPVTVASTQEFPINGRANVVRPKVDKLKTAGTKVNLISMVRNDAETVFQQIRELGMTGKGWVWLASDGATTSTFDKQKDLQRAMKGMLGVQPKNGAGSLYYRFLAAWMDGSQGVYPGRPNRSPATSVFMPQLFDAVHGVALALSDLVNKKQISRSSNVMTVRDKLYQKLKSFDDPSSGYPSATGNNDVMYFDQYLDGPPRYDVVNLQDNWITVGQYDPKTKDVTITRDPVFPGGTTIPIVGDGRPTYKIAAFFPKHSDLGSLAELGREWESAFKVAVSQVNADPNFKVAFSYILVDGGPSTETCDKAAKDLPDDIDLILGEARSTCSIAISKATRSRKIPQMSYASTSSKLSDKQAYPYFFRTCAADDHQAMALAKLVGRYGWERIGTIATTDDYAEDLARKFALDLRRTGVEITAEERFNMHTKHSVSEEMNDLKSSGAAVNLISSVTDDAEKVFQEAIEQGMTGKKWAWLGTDGSTSSTFINTPNLKHAMQGMVGTRPKAGDGQIYRELLKNWAEKDAILYPGLIHSSRVQETSAYVAQVQDAVLAFANALTRLHEAKTVTKLTPRPTMQRELIGELKKMKDAETGFDSAVGTKAFFDSNQDGLAEYDLVNLNGNSWIRVGSYTPSKGLSIRRKIVWPGGRLTPPSSRQPKDSTTSSEKVQKSSVSSSGLAAMGAVFGILAVALTGFIVFLIHRERRGKPSFGPNGFRRANGTVTSPVNNISDAMDGAAAVLNHGVIRSEEKAVPV